jgi:hypothetical protein
MIIDSGALAGKAALAQALESAYPWDTRVLPTIHAPGLPGGTLGERGDARPKIEAVETRLWAMTFCALLEQIPQHRPVPRFFIMEAQAGGAPPAAADLRTSESGAAANMGTSSAGHGSSSGHSLPTPNLGPFWRAFLASQASR